LDPHDSFDVVMQPAQPCSLVCCKVALGIGGTVPFVLFPVGCGRQLGGHGSVKSVTPIRGVTVTDRLPRRVKFTFDRR
jgi:hypothetical protein